MLGARVEVEDHRKCAETDRFQKRSWRSCDDTARLAEAISGGSGETQTCSFIAHLAQNVTGRLPRIESASYIRALNQRAIKLKIWLKARRKNRWLRPLHVFLARFFSALKMYPIDRSFTSEMRLRAAFLVNWWTNTVRWDGHFWGVTRCQNQHPVRASAMWARTDYTDSVTL